MVRIANRGLEFTEQADQRHNQVDGGVIAQNHGAGQKRFALIWPRDSKNYTTGGRSSRMPTLQISCQIFRLS